MFKRQEGFRFTFEEPVEADFIVLTDGEVYDRTEGHVSCKILDISPRGMKIVTDIRAGNHVQFEMHFILDSMNIKAIGDIAWSKPFGSKTQYGLMFRQQPTVEEIIIEELKVRRRKEIN